MRKILIGVLVVLLIIITCMIIVKGVSIGDFSILSVKEIIEENDNLELEILETDKLIESDYPIATKNLDTSVSELLVAKEEYLDLTSRSTEEELSKASIVETYTVEFLWTRLGRHATAEGVNLSYTTDGSSITFTVVGDYIPILEFVEALENDSDLAFRIENFNMLPNPEPKDKNGGDSLKATFITRNINVKLETATNLITQQTDTQSTELTNNNDETQSADGVDNPNNGTTQPNDIMAQPTETTNLNTNQ